MKHEYSKNDSIKFQTESIKSSLYDYSDAYILATEDIGLVVVISTTQLHSSKPKIRFCAGYNPARGMSEICDGEDL